MSYASLLFVAFVVVPPSRLSFFLLWLCRISSPTPFGPKSCFCLKFLSTVGIPKEWPGPQFFAA